jgi:hypothetical protein
LQEGKRYLDAERDVLFSRYGLASQEWTILGTVGHYAAPPEDISTDFDGFTTPENKLDRHRLVSTINALLSFIADQGLSDAPTYPGFSLVPIAVYRPIPHAGFSLSEDGSFL